MKVVHCFSFREPGTSGKTIFYVQTPHITTWSFFPSPGVSGRGSFGNC